MSGRVPVCILQDPHEGCSIMSGFGSPDTAVPRPKMVITQLGERAITGFVREAEQGEIDRDELVERDAELFSTPDCWRKVADLTPADKVSLMHSVVDSILFEIGPYILDKVHAGGFKVEQLSGGGIRIRHCAWLSLAPKTGALARLYYVKNSRPGELAAKPK